MIKLVKEVKKVIGKDGKEKRYTNYLLKLNINEKVYTVAIEPKTFGREWTSPSVRQSFTLLDLVSELVVVDDTK